MRENASGRSQARFGEIPVKLLDGAEIKGWLAALPLAVKTRNRHLGYVRNILGLALEANLLQNDSFERVNGFHDPHLYARLVAILSPDQLAAFLRAVDPDFLPYFALWAFSVCYAGGKFSGSIGRRLSSDRNLIDLPFAKSRNRG